jgi:hypothetical protein
MFSSAIPVSDGTFSDPSLQYVHIDYIIKKNFTCHEDEEALLNCTYYEKGLGHCNGSDSRMKPAGVYCFGQTNGQSQSLEITTYTCICTFYAMQKKINVMITKLDLAMVDLLTYTIQVVEWRSVWMVCGVQCAITGGPEMMPTQCADNWDIITVRKAF